MSTRATGTPRERRFESRLWAVGFRSARVNCGDVRLRFNPLCTLNDAMIVEVYAFLIGSVDERRRRCGASWLKQFPAAADGVTRAKIGRFA